MGVVIPSVMHISDITVASGVEYWTETSSQMDALFTKSRSVADSAICWTGRATTSVVLQSMMVNYLK